jgi:cytochrome c oxidase subunit 3
MALSISSIRKGKRYLSILFLTATLLLGAVFLLNKYVEWMGKLHHGLYPDSPSLLGRSRGEVLFYGLYYSMTGLHGLHVLVGIVLLSIMWFWVRNGKIDGGNYIRLENSGLYWHLVDIIWIFLFPLFYLIT